MSQRVHIHDGPDTTGQGSGSDAGRDRELSRGALAPVEQPEPAVLSTVYPGREHEVLLLQAVADGDEKAFAELFDLYVPRMYPVIDMVVHSESVVKDVIQDVFLRLWVARGTLRDIASPKDYIFRMTYNQSFKHLRKILREEKTKDRFAEREVVAGNEPDTPEELLNLSETRALIDEAMRALPEQSRKIYRLSRHSGYRPQEIADQLGINVQSVRNSLTRSGQQIKDHLAKNGIIIPLVLAIWCLR